MATTELSTALATTEDQPQTVAEIEVGHAAMANAIRALAMDAVQQANSGHPGMPLGMADVATVLFSRFLKFNPDDPQWPDRDRFVLSAGHGSMLLYALLYLTGTPGMTLAELKRFRQFDSLTPGHPEQGHTPGVETTTGPLGQGLANAVGMALAEQMLAARFGADLVDHYSYVIAGDGCLMEGISHEAISLAGHLGLSKLIVLFDNNGISIDGPTSLTVSDDQLGRFRAAGWDAQSIDGHDPDQIAAAIAQAQTTDTPSLIACRTRIGFGAPTKEGTASSHGAPLGAEEIAGARMRLNWPYEPFAIPGDILSAWRDTGDRGRRAQAAWSIRHANQSEKERAEFDRLQQGHLPEGWDNALDSYKQQLVAELPKRATRQSSAATLEVLTKAIPELVGGSADLTGSNNTKAASQYAITRDDFSGSYIHYGVREHAMAAAMNGMALHGGVIPYSGGFLVFSDYCRPAIRLAALMKLRVIHVMTHDSIGLGEDGPTHQPVEHLAVLRAIPNLNVFRPADAVETAECWQAALHADDTPSVLALSRQGLPAHRKTHSNENLCARGGYVIAEADGPRDVTILASGSEVTIAMTARDLLAAKGQRAAVVSMPCWRLFDQQSSTYQSDVLGTAPRIAVEAASPFGWTRYVKREDDVVGMTGFGASAPAEELYQHFGITPQAVAAKAQARITTPRNN